jgi:DNA-binding IclR family transcriptional regulator
MARPALSASRTMDILDLFAAFPTRSFTMSEIMRATGINVASCHAVLSVLTNRGYLARNEKSYSLGMALISLGEAAAQTQTLVARAKEAAQVLNKDLGVPVMLAALAGDDILTLASLPDVGGRFVGPWVGQRMPLAPPVGLQFLAWASDEVIAAWIGRGATDDEATVSEWRRSLARVRDRGYLVTLNVHAATGAATDFSRLMQMMAAGTQPLEYKAQTSGLISDYGWILEHPETIDSKTLYDVGYIAVPVFNPEGQAVLSLGLVNIAGKTSGEQIGLFAAKLMETCLRITQEERRSRPQAESRQKPAQTPALLR